MATTFQRARSDEQRALRRQAILDTAAAMLQEMPVAELSLNELSRRVGLAKSNVLRYFDSREAVLLELMVSSLAEWCAHLAAELPAAVSRRAGFTRRAEQLAGVIARSLVERPVLCDLMSAQAGGARAQRLRRGGDQVQAREPRRGRATGRRHPRRAGRTERDAVWRYVIGVWLMTSALWAHARPPEAVRQAPPPRAPPEARLDFPAALEDYLTTLAIGLDARRVGRTARLPVAG